MSWLRRFEISQPPLSSSFYREAAVWRPRAPVVFDDEETEEYLGLALDILNPNPSPFDLSFPFILSPLGVLDSAAAAVADIKRFQERTEAELFVQSLSDRVTALELGLERALSSKIGGGRDRKYEWTTEIKGAKEDGIDKKYKWTAEVKGGEERNFKWVAEFKEKGKESPASRKYSFQLSTAPTGGKAEPVEKTEKKVQKKKVSGPAARVVEIQEEPNPGAIAIRKAFAKSSVNHSKGKKKELSPQDAALIIQMTFRVYLVRRSKVLHGLRDLAVAKAKLKEIRALFFNFSYRRRITNDAEERQRFSEKIIVLLLTVDAIEGLDYLVRAAKKSMVEELEAMLEVVDPQPPGKLGSMKRRKFNLPDGGPVSKEMSIGVAEVVQMLDEEDNRST